MPSTPDKPGRRHPRLISAGLLLDGTGGAPVHDHYIAVENDKIAAVGGQEDFVIHIGPHG